jgi:hypothetical protein
MVFIKSWRSLLEGLGLMAWGYTFLYYIKDHVLTESLSRIPDMIDESFKLFTSIIGIIFLILRIVQYRKETKIKNENAKLDLEIKRKKFDLEIFELYERRARDKKNNKNPDKQDNTNIDK